MTYLEAKERYGERILSIACTDIVLAGINEQLRKAPEGYQNALGSEVLRCIRDINKSEWNAIRSIIKRSV